MTEGQLDHSEDSIEHHLCRIRTQPACSSSTQKQMLGERSRTGGKSQVFSLVQLMYSLNLRVLTQTISLTRVPAPTSLNAKYSSPTFRRFFMVHSVMELRMMIFRTVLSLTMPNRTVPLVMSTSKSQVLCGQGRLLIAKYSFPMYSGFIDNCVYSSVLCTKIPVQSSQKGVKSTRTGFSSLLLPSYLLRRLIFLRILSFAFFLIQRLRMRCSCEGSSISAFFPAFLIWTFLFSILCCSLPDPLSSSSFLHLAMSVSHS